MQSTHRTFITIDHATELVFHVTINVTHYHSSFELYMYLQVWVVRADGNFTNLSTKVASTEIVSLHYFIFPTGALQEV